MDVDANKQAAIIYEAICTTSADRPFSFQTAAQMHREIAVWQANNPGLTSLKQVPPGVQTAFLSQSVEWLRAESREHSNFRVVSTLGDAIVHALTAAPTPLPPELVLKLLTELRENTVTRYCFPSTNSFLFLVAIKSQMKSGQNYAHFICNMFPLQLGRSMTACFKPEIDSPI